MRGWRPVASHAAPRWCRNAVCGLVRLRRDGARLAFAAPPLRRSGAVEPAVLAQIARALGVAPGAIRASQWVDNGPGWVAVMLGSRDELLALRPDYIALRGLELGVVAPWVDGDAQFEVRAFITAGGSGYEDPVTGSLNASLAQWLIGAGLAPARYVAARARRSAAPGACTWTRSEPTSGSVAIRSPA